MSYVKIERIKIGLQINIYHLGRWSLLIPSYLVLVQQIVGTLRLDLLIYCVLTPRSAIFQLYHGDQF
jgi:hypothetical protein